jgi:hypothetical protein
VSVADFTEAACVGRAGPAQEVIQDLGELRRRHALVLESFNAK